MKKLFYTLFVAAVASATALITVPAAAQDVKGNAANGEKKIAMCIGCHGIQGYQASFPEIYKVPKISGQDEKYLVAALNAYKKDERKHPTMRGIAESLTDQDIADISAYYALHGVNPQAKLADKPSREAPAAVAALIQKGACISCHGANFAKPVDPSYPKIAGQYDDYLFVALKAYKTEGNPNVGRANGVMGGIAKQFTNAELKAMSKYIGSLEGDLKSVPQGKFR
ncbi:MAG: c-type cytochrome [Burkholderiaceae bacterium]